VDVHQAAVMLTATRISDKMQPVSRNGNRRHRENYAAGKFEIDSQLSMYLKV